MMLLLLKLVQQFLLIVFYFVLETITFYALSYFAIGDRSLVFCHATRPLFTRARRNGIECKY